MKTLIINGSPRGKIGNTEIFIEKFIGKRKDFYHVCYAAKEESLNVAKYIKEFDTVLIFMPLYVHAMPGLMMKVIECMEPSLNIGEKMGFIVQSGFMESFQAEYLQRYLTSLTKNLNYTYLGTVIRGGSAGVSIMPDKMNKKLFKNLGILGEYFEKNGSFNIDVVKELGTPYKLSKGKCKLLQFFGKFGIGDTMFWNMMLKQNNAIDRRLDKPFA